MSAFGGKADILLVGEDLVAQRVPALVEQMHVADVKIFLLRTAGPYIGSKPDKIRCLRHVCLASDNGLKQTCQH